MKKVFVVLLAFVFCLTLSSAAFGAGKAKKCEDFLVAGSSWKIPPGQLKKMNSEALKNFNGLNIQVKEKAKEKAKEKDKKKAKDKIKKEIKLKVKGKPFTPDLPPVIKEGRTLIPVRAVIMGLGASVEWDGEERKIIVSKGDITVELFIDEYVFYINGKKKELDVPAQLISNRTFVPLRFLALALNINVNYDEDNDEVIIGDEILESFIIGGKDILALEGVSVQSPGEAGATLKIGDFTNFGNISITPADEKKTTITVLLNGSVVEKEDLAAQSLEDGDVILAIVTTAGDNKTVTYYYKVTVTGIPSASFSFVGPYNLVETDFDVSGFAVNAKKVANIEDNIRLRYLLRVTEGNLNGKVVQYGDPAEGIFIIEDGKAYFGPQEGFTLADLPKLKSATGITTPFTIKNGLSQGVYKFTVSLVDLDDNVLVSSGQFSIVVGP